MGKKLALGLFAGALGAGLYAAYQKLDEAKKAEIKRNARDKADELRDRAVDYAFYANDAVSDLKDVIHDEMENTKGTVSDAKSQFADKAKGFTSKQSDDDVDDQDDQDDIVVDAKDAFQDSGIPSSADDLDPQPHKDDDSQNEIPITDDSDDNK
ncbi:YtxH domain-containing protein [Lentilactobacillus kefiri]|jgi:hypothetical protein|uniref:YtxH domain-containing protein n=2 Tax=Lentilactobacillus kefiri TaxID=33962 RepID=A0A8E1V1U6_LENKE|nr:YtxH domain-containing protein [Lentilactobacillus kefiri]KRL56794.1 hypothetical protein FD08_GL004144 [Lentilactobacillus parakefiri DSM 10551]KRM50707.1 hypothetical protein FC95_GL001871 [Lentilactobacillus kefiri DSM 20587 = JCM 5818]MCJ2160798.1 YtxH domain-containing protein [Lentilactobacillus kefiri]MCP9368053.1 YtxH domain-containing protein [Lentilactobacillus kefiri]MDH5107397.1 YtxH domain-containing protein [Lentilactobacillus kefiri]